MPLKGFRSLWVRFSRLSVGQVLVLYYAIIILAGGAVLSLPISSPGEPVPFIDSLFMATSAHCVTGLAVLDLGTRYNLFGQLVLLLLIQVGGLGITTFSVYIMQYLRKAFTGRERAVISETLYHSPVEYVRELIRAILVMTLVIEGVGAALLSLAFVPRLGLVKGMYAAVFLAVSAFCNAGLSLFPDNLVGYQGDVIVNVTVMGLIVLGGIGFVVIREVLDRKLWQKGSRKHMSLHTRVVLTTTAVLIVGGAALIYMMEAGGALQGLPLKNQVLVSFFQSITPRTAGFNTIDMNFFTVPTLFLIIFLMFVGASPGSCGGGVKTTSLALFYSLVRCRLRGSRHTNMYHRTIPSEIVSKTMSLVMLAILLNGFALFALLGVQHAGAPAYHGEGHFLSYAFEVVSAFGTVGLSMGATYNLNTLGKLVIILVMYVGRVGLLTVAFTMVRRSDANAPKYAEENLMVG